MPNRRPWHRYSPPTLAIPICALGALPLVAIRPHPTPPAPFSGVGGVVAEHNHNRLVEATIERDQDLTEEAAAVSELDDQ